MIHFGMLKSQDRLTPNRREFCQLLGAVPVATAVALGLSETPLLAATGAPAGSGAEGAGTGSFTLVKGSALQAAESGLATGAGSKGLASPRDGGPFTVVIMAEEKKAAAEFEWHEARDHIFQIVEGSTKFELGGTPTGAHQTKPGEWLAPGSDGAKAVMLEKGDLLAIPRGTPHKRTTDGRVVFQLVSIEMPAKA